MPPSGRGHHLGGVAAHVAALVRDPPARRRRRRVVQELLGHASVTTTVIYTMVTVPRCAEARQAPIRGPGERTDRRSRRQWAPSLPDQPHSPYCVPSGAAQHVDATETPGALGVLRATPGAMEFAVVQLHSVSFQETFRALIATLYLSSSFRKLVSEGPEVPFMINRSAEPDSPPKLSTAEAGPRRRVGPARGRTRVR